MIVKKLKISAKKVVLLILDGWGVAKPDKFNAIDNARKPNFDKLIREFPNVLLRADGPYVGLPEGQFGTSEINHGVIGSGRLMEQDLPRINQYIADGKFAQNPIFQEAFAHTKINNSSLHLIGIISDGKVHSSLEHMLELIKIAKEQGVKKIYIHGFADGRDVPPKSVEKYLKILDKSLQRKLPAGKRTGITVNLATLQGRFYLDRDRDWEKTGRALDLICKGKGNLVKDWQAAVNLTYNQNSTDEFMSQFVFDKNGMVKENDAVIFTHYRTDRLFQIVKGLEDRKLPNIKLVTFIEVSEEFHASIAFPRETVTQTLAEVLEDNGRTQFHIAETEKYVHLTFFLNGGREKEFAKETWKLIQSNRYVKPYYSFEPSMRAFDIAQEVVTAITNDTYDFIVVNFANTDMVGHTGNYPAAVIAAEAVDYCLGKIYAAIAPKIKDYALLVTADHGNSDEMWDYKNKQPHTQHTLNPVPFILASDIKCRLDKRESLVDLAPTVLDLMKIAPPEEMTGSSLIIPE